MVTDTGTVNATVGSGESAVPLTAEVSGKRVYIGDEFVFDYTIRLKINSSSSSINLTLDAERDAEGNTSIVIDSAILPLLGVNDISVSFTEEELNDTLPVLNLAAPTFYDAEKISGADGSYSIPGDSSLAWILWQVAPILAYDAGYDILPMIESWLTLGDVTGTLSFADGNFATMTTSQDITAYMPYEDAEFLAYNVEFFPMTLLISLKAET